MSNVELTAFWSSGSIPLTSPSDLPTVTITRIDNQVDVVSASLMTEIGYGNFSYAFAPDPLLQYIVHADGDPSGSGQVPPDNRFANSSLCGRDVQAIDDITLILSGVVIASGTVQALSTTGSIHTNITNSFFSDGQFNGHGFRLTDPVSGSIARTVDEYAVVSGVFDLVEVLPFLPTSGSEVFILTSFNFSSGMVG